MTNFYYLLSFNNWKCINLNYFFLFFLCTLLLLHKFKKKKIISVTSILICKITKRNIVSVTTLILMHKITKKKKRNPKYYFGLNTQKYKNKILHHTILLTKYLFIQDIFWPLCNLQLHQESNDSKKFYSYVKSNDSFSTIVFWTWPKN